MSDLSFTHIYEGARAALNLSRDKYALCNYIQTWSTYPGRCPGFCDRTQAQMAEFVGITDRGIRKMLQSLEAENLIERHPVNGLCRITKKWFNAVEIEKIQQEQSSAQPGTKFLIDRNKVPHQQEQSSAHKEKLKEDNLIKEKERVSANADLSLKKSLEQIDEAFTPVEAPSKKRKSTPGAQKEKKVEALPALDFSRFDNPEAAKEIFTRWLKYRKDIKHPYKSEDTILTSLKNLFNYSAGRAALAEQIIEKSIGNGYRGFFKPDAAPVAKKVGINHFGGDQSKYLEKQLF
jgi:hypothetical protein